jgi:hypothetical protein
MSHRKLRTAKSAGPRVSLTLLGVLAALATIVLGGLALAKDDLPTPKLTATPTDPTSATSASFTYTDTAAVSRFQCSLDGASYQDCGTTRPSSKSYGGLANGHHTFKVRALSGSKTSDAIAFSWKIERRPPTPTFSQTPPNPSESPVATFAWASHPATEIDHYQCREDDGHWFTCTSPLTYSVPTGKDAEHHFRVRAVDGAGDLSSEAEYRWKIKTQGKGVSFKISGGASGGLYPGAPARQLALTLTNPNNVAIYVTALTVSVTSSPAGCPAASNLVLSQASASSATPVQVPAGGSVTLPAQGVSAPAIQLLDLPVNQDACKSAGFGLTYVGSAHS